MSKSAPRLDGPTRQRIQKAGDNVEPVNVDIDGHENFATIRLLDGSPLAVLARRKQVTGEQFQAGARFYAHWYYSGLSPRYTIELKEQVDGGGPTYETDRQLYHRQKYHEAAVAVGMRYSAIVTHVVLEEKHIAGFTRSLSGYTSDQLRAVESMTDLRTALDKLDVHFNGERRDTIRRHLADGARPEFMTEAERQAWQAIEDEAKAHAAKLRRKGWDERQKKKA